MNGILPSQTIRKFISSGHIKADLRIPDQNIQPASLDLRIGFEDAIRLPGIFLPRKGGVREFAEKLCAESNFYQVDLTEKRAFILETGVPYLLPICEELELPENICAKANNKSSSGRLNLQVRLVCENHQEFDTIPYGYKGPLHILITAGSFPVQLAPGDTLNQIRFYTREGKESTKLTKLELKENHEKQGISFELSGRKIPWEKLQIIDDGLTFTANLKGDVVAYKFKGSATHALNLKERNRVSHDFFEPIYAPKKEEFIVLSKGGFYIIAAKEGFACPSHLCAEMVPFKVETGEFRSHYAGFFDPGWGCGEGQKGAAPVLEIIPYEDILLYDGQPVCVMDLYKMDEVPDTIYGKSGNNYHEQTGPRLSKHFKI